MTDVPESHPRYLSLRTRDAIVAGVEAGVTSVHGLIAHGRGEAFDYLLGERTRRFAKTAARAAAAMLLGARHPVLSVNGNVASLVPEEMVRLNASLKAPLEVNIFHASHARERAIEGVLRDAGAGEVLMPTTAAQLDHIDSNRRFVHPDGIYVADVVFVPLEDGDRCQALRKMGKEVITVDLNPLSRTAQTASITIVDNVVRALPLLLKEVEGLLAADAGELQRLSAGYDNAAVLAEAVAAIRGGEGGGGGDSKGMSTESEGGVE